VMAAADAAQQVPLLRVTEFKVAEDGPA